MDAHLLNSAQGNQLLAGLSEGALRRLLPDLQFRKLHVRDQIVGRGQSIEEVYFPLTCIISTVARGAADQVVEVATIGNEGMEGLPVFLGNSSTATLESFVQVPGDALSMPSRAFQTHLAREKTLGTIMGHYTQALLTQISQASACNRIHAAEERCARWLLMSHDRVHRDEFELTQEFLAQMLGVRRATVSEIAGALQAQGVVRYSRGRMTIVDRAALEERSCECYEIIRNEYTRLLPVANGARPAMLRS